MYQSLFLHLSKSLEKLYEEELSLFLQLLEDVRRKMNNGKARECLEWSFSSRTDGILDLRMTREHIIRTLFETRSETTAATMMYFILAMAHHPI